ncbi:Alpha-(1 3)-fucosyltransferase 7 [Mactra antiquata]
MGKGKLKRDGFWSRRRCIAPSRYWKLFVLLLIITVVFGMLSDLTYMSTEQVGKLNDRTEKQFKTIVTGEPVLRTSPKILLYTNFFGSMKWYHESKDVYQTKCPLGCTLTNDKSQIESADAVVYHLSDIASQSTIKSGFSFSFPKYRRQDQVWVFFNIEPLTMIWGDMTVWQGMFNWTWSYTQNSDVYAPYGSATTLNAEEAAVAETNSELLNADFFGAKTENGGIAMISHCTDEARRYRIIGTLQKYIPVRIIGRCGEGCPDGYLSCNALLPKYKFYLAFENSDCEDYVSEKYWRSLARGQIPIVAWKLYHDDIAIPGSYINVYDFPSIDAAGSYIQEVNKNKTLYNSYFKWRFTHKLSDVSGFCELCRKLKDDAVPRMVYHDMNGWIMNQTCKPVTVSLIVYVLF